MFCFNPICQLTFAIAEVLLSFKRDTYYLNLQGTTVRVEFGDGTTVAEASDSHIVARAFPHTLGQPLAHFLREAAKVSDAHIITQLPSIRYTVFLFGFNVYFISKASF